MDIVITCAVGYLQHYGAVIVRFGNGIIGCAREDAGLGIAVRIICRSIHKALCIMSIVKIPVIDTAAGNAVMEGVGMVHEEESGHRSSERKALYADLVPIDIRKRLQVFGPLHKIKYFPLVQAFVNLIQALATIMAGSAAVSNYFNDAVLGIPFKITRRTEIVHHLRSIRTAINIHVYRIFFRLVEIFRIDNHCRKLQSVLGRHRNHLRQSVISSIETGTCHISDLEGLGRFRKVINPYLRRCPGIAD